MAVTLGTSAGFVTVAPDADPGGTTDTRDNYGIVTRDALPANAAKITKMGVWVDNATEAANMRFALYDDNGAVVPGEAGDRLFLSDDVAKGTDAGWKTVTVNWDVSAYAGTNLWLACGIDNTATGTTVDKNTGSGSGTDGVSGGAALGTPFGGGAIADADGILSIYAVWEAAAGGNPYYAYANQ